MSCQVNDDTGTRTDEGFNRVGLIADTDQRSTRVVVNRQAEISKTGQVESADVNFILIVDKVVNDILSMSGIKNKGVNTPVILLLTQRGRIAA